MTKNQQLNKTFLAEVAANGGDVRKAFDTVFGEGAYEAMATDLYYALREKAGK